MCINNKNNININLNSRISLQYLNNSSFKLSQFRRKNVFSIIKIKKNNEEEDLINKSIYIIIIAINNVINNIDKSN